MYVLSFVSFVSLCHGKGVFGMNVKNSMEDNKYFFFVITMVLIVIMTVATLDGLKFGKEQKLL